MSELQEDERRYDEGVPIPSIVTIEEATVDGNGLSDVETPVKRAGPSEMHLGRSRPKGMYEDENSALRHLRVVDCSARVNLFVFFDRERNDFTPRCSNERSCTAH